MSETDSYFKACIGGNPVLNVIGCSVTVLSSIGLLCVVFMYCVLCSVHAALCGKPEMGLCTFDVFLYKSRAHCKLYS